MSFLVLPQHEQFYPEGLSVFAPCKYLRIQVGQSQHQNSRIFQHRLQFSRIFKALKFYFKIQGLSRCVRTLYRVTTGFNEYSLGPGSAVGKKGDKEKSRERKKIGEQSEPSGSLGKESLPVLCCFQPIFCAFPYCRAWPQARPIIMVIAGATSNPRF